LLPSGSWGKILAGLEVHFGEIIELDPELRKIIAEYLQSQSCGTFVCETSREDHEKPKRSNTTEDQRGSRYSGKTR
jgi:hypothetical protein